MDKKFMMTAFSKDRPGIVADITEVLFENRCNLEDSTMTKMLDEFVIILMFTGAGDGLEEQLVKDCRRLERDKGITAFIRSVEHAEKQKQIDFSPMTITVEGIDQTGIVFKVTRFLADNNINIDSLTTRRSISPESGTAMYFMEMKVEVPAKISAENLKKGLSRVGEELNLDISVR